MQSKSREMIIVWADNTHITGILTNAGIETVNKTDKSKRKQAIRLHLHFV